MPSNALQSHISPAVLQFLSNKDNDHNESHAYLSWMLLDEEQLRLVDAGSNSGFIELGDVYSGKGLLQSNNGNDIEVLKNGYLYVYASSSNAYDPVYFDDLRIEHIRGPLLEEKHYYPFGLEIVGISSEAAAFGGSPNLLQFNFKEVQQEEFAGSSGLDWTDFGVRMYDHQIGRWNQAEPLADIFSNISPYVYAFNNPLNFIEVNGMNPTRPNDGPRVAYASADAAAFGWARVYGATSLVNHTEFASIIYQVGDKYYFTTAMYYRKRDDRWASSPSWSDMVKIWKKWRKPLPAGATVVGHIHSHHWTGDVQCVAEGNRHFSTNNSPDCIKRRSPNPDDERMEISFQRGDKVDYYLFNFYGEVWKLGYSRPESDVTVQDQTSDAINQTTKIGQGLSRDPDATFEGIKGKLPYKFTGPKYSGIGNSYPLPLSENNATSEKKKDKPAVKKEYQWSYPI